MRKSTLLALMGYLGFVGLVFWACGGHSPTTPSFGPSAVPIGPKPGPVGPSARPVGPSGAPVGPSPSGPVGGGTPPAPAPTTSGGSGGGPGGGTPTPPGGSGGTVPCPATFTVNAVGLPMLVADTYLNPNVFPRITTDYVHKCVIKEVRVAMRVTTVTGFVGTYRVPSMEIVACGSRNGVAGCAGSKTYQFLGGAQASGNQIGTTCSDFVFDTTETTVWVPTAPPLPPYSGTYQWDPARVGVAEPWRLNNLLFEAAGFTHPPDALLECARIDIETQMLP